MSVGAHCSSDFTLANLILMVRGTRMSALLAAALVALQGCTKVNVSQILKGFEGTAVELSAITGGVGSRGCNIVMVMDNSGSMADEQAALAVAVQALAQIAPSFSSANLRFFSLTTDFYLDRKSVV